MPFIGKSPTAGFASIVKDDLTPNGSTTAFTLSKQVANANDIAVFVGNVRQEPTDAYTVNGTTLTMSEAVASGLNFYVLHIAGTVESSVVPADDTISTAKIQNDAITGAKIENNPTIAGNLTVSGNTAASGTLTSTGLITASAGVAIGGTGTANTLDDYEEGTWSPTIVGYGGGNTQTYQFQNGQYTKIGRQVVANYSVRLTAKGNISGNYVHIMNLPFAISTTSPAIPGSGLIHYIWSIGTARDNFAWEMGGGTADRCWLTYTDSTTTSYVTTSDIGNTTGFMGTLIYITDA